MDTQSPPQYPQQEQPRIYMQDITERPGIGGIQVDFDGDRERNETEDTPGMIISCEPLHTTSEIGGSEVGFSKINHEIGSLKLIFEELLRISFEDRGSNF